MEEPTQWKRPWCWERLRAWGEGDVREWDGISDSMNMSLSKLQGVGKDREACLFALHAIKYSWSTRRHWQPHSSTLAWKIPWVQEPGRLQSMGSLRVRHDWATSLSLFTFMHWRRKWQPTPVFLPGESQGREPGGLPSMGSHRVGHDWRVLAAAVKGKLEIFP